MPSTLVRITSDEGHEGWGEVCPLGTTYLPAHAGGARAALELIAPHLIGVDPTNHAAVNDRMDAVLSGHLYAKSPVDVACWDLTGKAWGASVATLLGGVRQASFPLYFAVPLGTPETEAAIRRWSPTGRLPAYRDGEILVWDSLAICEHLLALEPRGNLR